MNLVEKLIDITRSREIRIVVIGDAMTDVYVHGRLGMGQEDCPKFIEESRVICNGGAANAHSSLHRWGCKTSLFSVVNTDRCVKTRYMVGDKFAFRHDLEKRDATALTSNLRNATFAYLEDRKNVIDGILISDYDKGFLGESDIQRIIKIANARNIPVVSDAKRKASVYAGSIIKGNRDYWLRNTLQGNCVMTDGHHTPRIASATPLETKVHPSLMNKVDCVNHVGAGDCFAAHLTLAVACGLSLHDAVTVAHSAGRVYVQHRHNRAPWPHEIRRDFDPVGGKIISMDDLPKVGSSCYGKLVVFTNGVFRVPHAGHAWLMRWAKDQGDVLVVGVNDDESTARIRPGEYAMPCSERMHMLAAMDAVDYVVPFPQDEPLKAVSLLIPNVLVKGSMSKAINIPGSSIVNDVRFAPDGPFDTSATQIIQEIGEGV